MSEVNPVVRLSKAAREFNISIDSVIEFLGKKGFVIDRNPNTRLEPQMYELLFNEFKEEKHVKEISKQKGLEFVGKQKTVSVTNTAPKEDKKAEEPPIEEDIIITNTGVEYFKKSLKKVTSTEEERGISKPVKPEEEKKPVEDPKPAEADKPTESPEILTEEKEAVVDKPAVESEVPEKETVDTTEKTETIVTAETEKELPVADEVVRETEVVAAEDEAKTPVVETHKATEAIEEAAEEGNELEEVYADDEEETDDEQDDLREEVEEKKRELNILGKIDLESLNQKTRPRKKSRAEKRKEAAEKSKSSTQGTSKDTQAPKQEVKEEKKPEHPEKKAAPPVKEVVVEKKEESKPQPQEEPKADNFLKTTYTKLDGPQILGKIELPVDFKRKKGQPVASSSDDAAKRKKRKRIKTKLPVDEQPKQEHQNKDKNAGRKKPNVPVQKAPAKVEPSDEEIQKKIKDTLARLAPVGKSKSAKYRKQKRETVSQHLADEMERQAADKSILKVTEFLTANELANMMSVGVTQIITTCMQLGMFVSINQRLDAETIALVAEEFGFKVEFVGVDDADMADIDNSVDDPADLVERAPIVTVMGHVDHGKTKLLDYVRKANVVAGEAGGITQHIGAYEVTTDSGKKVTFLDTPGHEAFTAMRARGAKVTDIAIIVIAADDSVMPQTREAINHAQAAGVPIVFAFNKMDKPGASSEKIKEQLANMNILVEDWGGKFQSQEISAITGMGIADLLEKVLLEAEILELKANPNKPGRGTVIESSLDKGRGFQATVLVQDGTLSKGDIMLAGPVFGKVKAMFNERNKVVKSAGPSVPVLVLGLNSAPQAGDVFNVMSDEKEAKNLSSKRQQLLREQSLRTQKHITLDEIGRRIAIGDFKELNIIVKGDVDGSIEALSDALLKLSTQEVQVNIIH
jgi:translation initiation factor IF-2